MDAVCLGSQEELNHFILKGVSMIDFNAPWCGPCRAQGRIISDLQKHFHGKAAVVIVNVDESQGLAFSLGIQSIPTIIIFKDGREVQRFIGLQTSNTLNNALKMALAR